MVRLANTWLMINNERRTLEEQIEYFHSLEPGAILTALYKSCFMHIYSDISEDVMATYQTVSEAARF